MEINNNINKNINNAPFFDMMNDDIPHNEYDNIKCKKNEIIYNDNVEEDNGADNDVKNKLLNKKELPVSKIFLFVIFAVLICLIIYIIINLISNRNDNKKKVKKNKNGKNECVESDSDSNTSSSISVSDDDNDDNDKEHNAKLIQNALKTKKPQHNSALQTDVPCNDNNSTQYIQHQQMQQHPIQQNEQQQEQNEQEQNEDIDKKTQIRQNRDDLLNSVKSGDNNEQDINNMIMNKIGNLKISKLQKIDEDLSNYNNEDNESNNSENKKSVWQNNTHENSFDNCAIIETKKRGRPKKITELISENNE